jgi:hypothetical protein
MSTSPDGGPFDALTLLCFALRSTVTPPNAHVRPRFAAGLYESLFADFAVCVCTGTYCHPLPLSSAPSSNLPSHFFTAGHALSGRRQLITFPYHYLRVPCPPFLGYIACFFFCPSSSFSGISICPGIWMKEKKKSTIGKSSQAWLSRSSPDRRTLTAHVPRQTPRRPISWPRSRCTQSPRHSLPVSQYPPHRHVLFHLPSRRLPYWLSSLLDLAIHDMPSPFELKEASMSCFQGPFEFP